MTAATLLRSYSKSSLERMARQRRLETKGQNKETLISMLAPTLFDAKAIRRALAALSPVERRVLDEVRLLGGDAPTGLIERRLEREGIIKPRPPRRGRFDSPRNGSESSELPNFDAAVARLGTAGLVFSSMPGTYGTMIDLAYPGQRLFIPKEVLEYVPTVPLPVATTATPAKIEPAQPAALLRDVYTILSAATQAPIPLTARGLIAKRALTRLDAQLRVPEDAASVAAESELVRLPLLRALLEDLGVLAAHSGSLVATDRVSACLSQPPGDRRGQLMRTYRQTTRWCELLYIKGLQIQPVGGYRGAPQEIISARQRVLVELAELPVDRWILLDDVVERLKRRAYELLFPRQWSSYTSYYSNPYRASGGNPMNWDFTPSLDEERAWDLVEGGLIRVIVGQVLHWLGVVDIGHFETGSVAIRVTPDGALLLHDRNLPTVVSKSKVVVQPNFQVFAFEPTDESVLFTLDQLADRIRAEQVVEYQLSRDSVYRAQRTGLDAAAIVAFLEQVSTVPLPQNVRRSLEEWGALHERVVVHHGVSLLHAVDAPTLDGLYADPQVAPLLGRRVAPTAALVALEHLVLLRQRLLESDYLPALSEGAARPAQPAFTLADDGRVCFRQRLPDIAALQAVQQAANQESDGSTGVTRHSLQRAAAHGLSDDDVIASLERFHTGPLPPEVVHLVRRWTKRWGRGALAAVTLLQVETAEVLADLLADPEARPYVRRLEGAATVAVVPADSVARVRSVLEARGMQLADQLL